MKLYKLTDQNGKTQNDTHWGEGVTIMNRPKENPRMCSGDVLHAYTGFDLAFLMNPTHANISNPRVFEAEGDVVVFDPLKVGCFTLTTTREIEKPWWVGHEDEKRVRVLFAVLCAESVNRNQSIGKHLETLKSMAMSGTFDKTATAAERAAKRAAERAAAAAKWAAERAELAAELAAAVAVAAAAAERAAEWAAERAELAAELAVAAVAVAELAVAAVAARAARAAAAAAERAAERAELAAREADSRTGNKVDFAALAEQAANTILGLL